MLPRCATTLEGVNRSLALGGDHVDARLDLGRAELCRMKRSAVPSDHVLVLWMAAARHRLDKVHETGRAAYVLGWGRPLASDEDRAVDIRIGWLRGLDDYAMLPVVAEVVV